jgi:hypothetical protein
VIARSLEREILDQIGQLDETEQRRVLEFARLLSRGVVKGVPGTSLLKWIGAIPSKDLDEMSKAIEEGCERVDHDGW